MSAEDLAALRAENAELRGLLAEAIEAVGGCCDCLNYRTGEAWWDRIEALGLIEKETATA